MVLHETNFRSWLRQVFYSMSLCLPLAVLLSVVVLLIPTFGLRRWGWPKIDWEVEPGELIFPAVAAVEGNWWHQFLGEFPSTWESMMGVFPKIVRFSPHFSSLKKIGFSIIYTPSILGVPRWVFRRSHGILPWTCFFLSSENQAKSVAFCGLWKECCPVEDWNGHSLIFVIGNSALIFRIVG